MDKQLKDLDENRKQFEQWALDAGLKLDRNVYRYAYYSTNTAWQAWVASREIIVVDLPDEMTWREASEKGLQSAYAAGFTDAVLESRVAITSIGLTIGEKSDE